MTLFTGWRSMARRLLPDGVVVPAALRTRDFYLEPLAEEHSDGDYEAWMSSIEHIQATPGFIGWVWPPSAGMTKGENLASVRRHARHHAAGVGFTYAVLTPSGDVIGCVYIYPAADARYDCELRTWVRADRADLDRPVHEAVLDWLNREWPFRAILSHPRA